MVNDRIKLPERKKREKGRMKQRERQRDIKLERSKDTEGWQFKGTDKTVRLKQKDLGEKKKISSKVGQIDKQKIIGLSIR